MQQIIIITQHFYPEANSTAQLMNDLANGFTYKGYQVNVFTQSSSQAPTVSNNWLNRVKILRSPLLDWFHNSLFYKVVNSLLFIISGWLYVIFRVHCNTPIIIVSNPPYSGVIGIYFRRINRGKFYFILQDIFPESAVMCGMIKPTSILFKLFSNLTYLTCINSESTVVLTQAMKDLLERKHCQLKTKKSLVVIENWSIENIPIERKNNNKFAIKYNLDQTFTLLYSGNLGRLHDIESIGKSAQLLEGKPIKFVFIGDGLKKKGVKKYIEKYRLKNILLLPFQPRELIVQSLTACDISLVSIIKGAEEIIAPCKLYGMLASGRAIISISSPGSYIDQLLTEYDCGINCPPDSPQQLADMIMDLAVNPDRVKTMGKRARQLYEEKYTFNRALDEYEKLLFGS